MMMSYLLEESLCSIVILHILVNSWLLWKQSCPEVTEEQWITKGSLLSSINNKLEPTSMLRISKCGHLR